MTRLKFSAILLGATALTLPMGTSAFAQQNQQGQTQQGQQQQAVQPQQGQQGQQAAAQQNQEMGACEKLLQVLRDAGEEDLLEQFRNVQQTVDQGDNEACALVIREVEQAGGISEQAVAEGRGVQFVSERETFRATGEVTETVEIQRQAIVEGEVLVRQPIPEVEIQEGEAEVQVRERPGRINIEEQPASIEIRQQPANVRVAVPRPTVMIEQPAPEIIITMPAPGLSVERDQPQVDVVVAEPTVTVTQDEPQVEVNVDARLVDESEAALIEGEDRPRVRTRAQRVTERGQEATEDAEVAVRKVKPSIRFMTADVQDEVTFSRANPRVSYQAAEPNVEVTFNEEPRVEIRQVGDARVRIRREGDDQAMAPVQGQGQQRQQQQAETQQGQQGQQTQQDEQATLQMQGQQGQAAQGQQGQQPTLQVQGQQTGQQGEQQFQAGIVPEEGLLIVEQNIADASQALEQEDFQTARTEIEQAGQELDTAMQTADEQSRQQMQALREQLDLVVVELEEQDRQGAQTALLDADTNLRQNRDVWLGQQRQATVQPGQGAGQRLSIEETNRLLAAEEGAEFGQAQPTRMRAGDLRGANVHTVRGEELGEIEEIVTSNNQLYAIVEHGGFLGIGGDQVAIPLERIAIRGDEVILLGLTEEQLEQMPSYDFERDQEFSATQEVEIGRFE